MAGVKHTNLRRSLFKRLATFALPREYTFPSIKFTVNNQENFQTSSAVYSENIRNKYQIHRPNTNISYFQKTAYYVDIKIFNSLPSTITSLTNKDTT
jgi:hypothetical protein